MIEPLAFVSSEYQVVDVLTPLLCCVNVAPESVESQIDPDISPPTITVPESLIATEYQYLIPAAVSAVHEVPESTERNKYPLVAMTIIEPSRFPCIALYDGIVVAVRFTFTGVSNVTAACAGACGAMRSAKDIATILAILSNVNTLRPMV
jgi:hypothetical protein